MLIRRLSLVAVLAVGATALAACGATASAPPGTAHASASASKAPYLLTLGTDLSSDFTSACCSIPLADGFQAWVAHVNSQGGVDGHKINLQVLSDNAQTATGIANFQQAVNSNSLGYLLNASSNVYQAVVPLAMKDKIVESSGGGYNGGVGVYPYIYNIFANLPEFVSILPKVAKDVVPSAGASPKLAYISYQSALSETFPKPIESAFSTAGWSTAYSQLVPTTATDFSVAASQIAAAKPDLVITDLLVGQLPEFVSQLRADGNNAPIVEFSANIDDATKAKIDEANVYYVEMSAPATNTADPGIAQMRNVGTATGFTTGMKDNSFYILGYVNAQVTVAALAKCSANGQTCTRASFNSALNDVSVAGNGLMGGRPGFSPSSHVMTNTLVVDHWVPGGSVPQVLPQFPLG